MNPDTNTNVLLIESDAEIAEPLAFYLQSHLKFHVTTCQSLEQGLNLAEKSKSPIHYIILSGQSAEHLGIFLKKSANSNTTARIIVCAQNRPKSSTTDIEKCYDFIFRPNFVNEFAILFDVQLAQSIHSGDEGHYILCSFPFLKRYPIAKADYFIKLNHSHFIRAFHKSEPLSREDFQRFEFKGLQGFFILKADFNEMILELTTRLAKKLDSSTSSDAPASIVIESQALIDELVRHLGITPHVKAIVEGQIRALAHELKRHPKLNELLAKMQQSKSDQGYTHSVMTGLIASHIAARLEWTSEVTFQKLTLAALLHDTLAPRANEANIQYESELLTVTPEYSSTELQEWREHAEKAGALIQSYTDLPPDAAVIIQQHHEFPDGSGLKKLTLNQITPLSSVFILAHDYAHFYLKTPCRPIQEYVDYRKGLFSKGIFKRALDALEEVAQEQKAAK